MKKRVAVFNISGRLHCACDEIDEAKETATQVAVKLSSALEKIMDTTPGALAGGVTIAMRPQEFQLNEKCVEGLTQQLALPLAAGEAETADKPNGGRAAKKDPPGVVSITRGGRRSKKKGGGDSAAPN